MFVPWSNCGLTAIRSSATQASAAREASRTRPFPSPGRSAVTAESRFPSLDMHHRLPLARLGRVEHGVADGLGGERLAEGGAGGLAGREVVEEVGDLVDER